MKILVTGGAGFIGSKFLESIDCSVNDVCVVDCFNPQVHVNDLNFYQKKYPDIRFVKADIKDLKKYSQFLADCDCLIHLAAETGTAQSMYEISSYVSSNVYGLAMILDFFANNENCCERIILASSRSVYGEGRYLCNNHGKVFPFSRLRENLDQSDFQMQCPVCNQPVLIQPTDEQSNISCFSIYAHTKYSQEELVRLYCVSNNLNYVILRLQNVYGEGQSLNNPYTGILSIFCNRIRQGLHLDIYEDGLMVRDFVHVDDVVNSLILGLNAPTGCYNVGSGEPSTIIAVTSTLVEKFAENITIHKTGSYRTGDIKGCYADLSLANEQLGYYPMVDLNQGLDRLIRWVQTQPIFEDGLEKAEGELKTRGLMS